MKYTMLVLLSSSHSLSVKDIQEPLRIDTGGWAAICGDFYTSATKSHALMINTPSKSSYFSLFIHVKHCTIKTLLKENENLM